MKQLFTLGAASSANIALAFLFQWYIIARIGPGLETDALFAGMTIPQLVFVVVSDSLMHVLVPILAGECEARFRHDAWAIFILIGALFVAISGLLYMTAPMWVIWTVPGFSPLGQSLTVELTRIQLVGMVFTALSGVQWAAYHARQKFIWAEVSPFLCGLLALILLVWALPRHGVVAVAWIGTMRSVLQVIILMPIMGSFVSPDFTTTAMREVWGRIKPLLLGNLYYKTDTLVDRLLLSLSAPGSLSLYFLGQQFYGAGHAIVNKAFTAPLVPRLSLLYKSGDLLSFKGLYRKSLNQILAISILIVVIFVFTGNSFLQILVGWGAFKSHNIFILWSVMIGMSGVFIGGAASQVTSSTFYASGDTHTPTKLSVISYSLFIPIKIVSFYWWGVMGIAVSSSVYYCTNLAVQCHFLARKNDVV